MPYTFTVESDLRLVTFQATGVLSNEEFLGSIREILDHPDVGPGFSFLVDLTKVIFHEPGAPEMRTRVEVDKDLLKRVGAVRVALVANLPHVFGMIRMYELLMGAAGPEVRSFGHGDDASRWLRSPGAGEAPISREPPLPSA